MATNAPAAKARRSLRLLAWAALPVLALAGTVQVTGAGIDILVFAAAGLILFALERSVGDLLGEWFGPLASAAIVVVAVVGLSWYFLSESLGRSRTDRFFAEAERRGYRTVYYQAARSTADDPPAESPSTGASRSVATGGSADLTTPATESPSAPVAASARSDDETPTRETPPSSSPARRPENESSAKRAIRSFFRRNVAPAEPSATQTALSLSPSRVTAAHRTVITATVVSNGVPVNWGTVEFTVNGLGAGRVRVNGEGVASTTFQTHIPGTYEVRARFAGSPEYSSSHSTPVMLSVVGGR
jgi:hypothetical protein